MDITVRRTGEESTWSLEDLLGRPMGTIAEHPPKHFTIHPEGQAAETMRGSALARMGHWTQHWLRSRPTQEVCVGWTSIMANSRNRCCRVGPQRSELRAPISRLPRTYCLPAPCGCLFFALLAAASY